MANRMIIRNSEYREVRDKIDSEVSTLNTNINNISGNINKRISMEVIDLEALVKDLETLVLTISGNLVSK